MVSAVTMPTPLASHPLVCSPMIVRFVDSGFAVLTLDVVFPRTEVSLLYRDHVACVTRAAILIALRRETMRVRRVMISANPPVVMLGGTLRRSSV